jgi:hypothetical protein
MKTYQECKEKIAKENSFPSWLHMSEFAPPYKFEQAIKQVADLYAQQFKGPTQEEINQAAREHAWQFKSQYTPEGLENVESDFKAAVEWYKQQIE